MSQTMATPAHEGIETHAHHGDGVVFDAILTPHRSLSRRGFALVMGVFAALSFGVGTAFFLAGAWPVLGLCGLEVLLVYAAFKANFRAARMYETVTVTRDDLTVARVSPRGDAQHWRFQPAWLQVWMDDPPRHDSQLTLRSHGRSLTIGTFLTAHERADFARALRGALDRARQPEPMVG
ncbi:Uncharacterized membrane protein [Limimonas halophila]|uniref:Uncharacterized membrane protein n=1 Tax=Limimonas halophila TaxID=1082479 RepID=A0A1G7TZU2_9PROT|nr:DUF2244 domain-containing protein [Limimonas halophila]SDG40796.1 Uncharacterized membrane protein [Limimonas halophila]